MEAGFLTCTAVRRGGALNLSASLSGSCFSIHLNIYSMTVMPFLHSKKILRHFTDWKSNWSWWTSFSCLICKKPALLLTNQIASILPQSTQSYEDCICFMSSLYRFILAPSTQPDNKLPTAATHSLPALLFGTNTNLPPQQMEAAAIKTLSSTTVLCKTQQHLHTTTEQAC